MAGDKFDQLYNALKADGAVTGTREHFRKFVYAPGKQGYHNRKQLYDALHADGAVSSNSYEEFAQRLGLHAVNPKPQQKPVAQQKPMTTAQRAMQVPQQYQRRQLSKAPKSAPKNASPFVQSLYEMDDAQNGAGYPVDYTSPKATQQVYQRNQRIRRQATKTAAKKINRQASHAQPIMQTNTPADIYIGKTEGQLMDEMNQSANALVGSEMGDYLDKVIGDEFKAAHARGLATLSANSGVHGTGGADWWIGERAYQNQMDQDKQLQEITGNIQKNIESIFSNPKVKQRVLSDAQKLGVSPETYIESSLAPALIEKAGKQFNNTQLNRMMAKGASDYIASGILNSLTGTLLTGLTSTKSQRQMQQQADAMTEEGFNPNYKPGTWAKASKGAVAFAADAPWYNLAGVGAGALTEKFFGNAAQQMARTANQSLRQRVLEGVARGIVHGGATGFQYGAINGAVQNYSTGEDTSLWGTLKAAAKGGLEEGVSFATMEGMGGAVGAFGYGIGLKGTENTWKQRVNKMGQKLTYEGIKTGMEGIGMATGGVASSYANHILTGDDWHGFSTEGTLESCASAVIFKLTHAKDLFKNETDRNGKPFSFTSNIAQKTARFFLSGEAKSAPHVFSDEEKHQLFAAGSELGMKPMENIVSWAKQAKKYRAEDIEKSEDGSDLLNNYQQIMLDPNVSWDAKAKFTTMVMGTMPESRPMMDHISYGTEDGTDEDNRIHTYKTVNEYAADGTLLSKHRFDTKDKRESIIYEIGVRKEELRSKNALALLVGLDRNNYDLQNSFFKKNAKDWEQVQEIVEGMQTGGSKIDHQFTEYVLNSERGSFLPIVDAVASKNGMDRESMLKAFDKDPMKRSDEEQNACVQLRKAIEMSVFPANKVHEEQSVIDGKDVATDNNLGTEQPNGGAVKAELDGLRQSEAEMDELMRDNDVFGQNFQKLKQQGLTNPQIYDWMVQQGGLTVEQLEPFAHYINANARVQGMQEATKNAIDEQVSSYVQDWSFHGTLNGQEKNGEQAIYVQDSNGRTLLVGTGEVAFDTTTGRAKEGVGDMLVCLDPKTGDTVYVKSDEVKFVGTQSTDDFANGYRQELQMKNSEPYNQAAQEQAMQDAAKPQPVEKSKDDATKGGDLTKDDTTLTKVDTTSGKDNTTSEDLVPQEQPQPTRKFADGSDVPMTNDSKGRPTPDYEKMTPEQSAEILTEDFGENADKVVDGQIQKAEKALKDAEKMKVDYTAEPNDIMEQEALKKKTVEAAKKQLEHAQNIKKTMTAKKVAETVGNTEQAEGAHEAGSVAAQKFENAPRLVGNKRTRMLADGETKIRGHYEIVPAESLTPSHDVNNGYKKSDGFPTDAEGRTVNDRDYEHDKAAQQNTDQIARKYNGMAIEQVPVVSDEGIVYDGNGRTMAGQKAAKEGTDGEYINDLLENAENFGFTREQIEQSGIEHPRLVLVTDERLPYDTATFSKFNRNEKKTQSNTEQAVAKAKTLTSDEVGAIVADIEGSGSLDAFFNNSKAINDLVKTLVEKGIIGQNEVAQMMDSPERLSAQGREYVKNLLLGSIFKPETIRMLGINSAVKNKAINAIRSVMDNMKLGEFSLRDEIDQAIQLLYEARQGGNKVDTLLRTSDMFGDDAAKRYPSISQMMALALEGKVADFRDLLDEYNRIAASRNTGEGNMFEAAPTKEELINEYLNFKKWQDYGTGHSENEGSNDVSGVQEPKQETSGGDGSAGEGAEPERPRVEDTGDKELGATKVSANPKATISERKQDLLDRIASGTVKRKDEAWGMLADAEELLAEYYGIPYDEYGGRQRTSSTTIDIVLNIYTKGVLDKITDEPIPAATEKQMNYLMKLAKGEHLWESGLEGMIPNKRQASWLINAMKGLGDEYLLSIHPDEIEEREREIYKGIDLVRKANGANAYDWDRMRLLPREEKPDPQFNPIEAAAAEFKKEHPLTEEEIMKSDVDDLSKDMALDYLNGEVTDDLHRAIYESIYAKRKELNAEPKVDTSKTEPSANPMEEIKNAAEGFENEKKTKIEQGEKPQQKADDAAVSASNKKVNDLWKELMDAGKDEVSSSFIGLNSRQLEVLPKLVSAMAENAYLRIKRGMHNLEDVVKEMRKEFAHAAKIFKKEDVDAIYEQMMNIRYRDGEKRMSLKEWADYYEKISPKHQENLVGDSKSAEERKQNENSFINRIQTVLSMGEFKTGIAGMRKIAEDCGLEGVKDTDLQELVETAVVGMARRYASSKAMSDDVKFAKIKLLYNRQPSLNQRDSDRVMKQQYSTPAPYAYLADVYVKGNGKEIKSALEPSAGNGMLTIGLPKDAVHVNDIDAQRLENLRKQGFKNVTSQDGTQPFADKDVDVVVTNPPFGSATPKEYDGYKISSLEGQMAINALESMKDDGRAAIIIGGKTEYAKNGSLNPKDKAFLGYLYSHYNVEDVINVDGSLYAKQGTSYPTRIILINGRRLDENAFPPVKDKARAETVKDYDELYKRIEDDILRGERMDSSIGRETRSAQPELDKQGSADTPKERVRAGERGGSKPDGEREPDLFDSTSISGTNDDLENQRGTEPRQDGELPDGDSRADGTGTEPSPSKEPTAGTNEQRGNGSGGAGRNDDQPSTDESTNAGSGSGSRGQLQRVDKSVRGLSTEKVTYAPKSENPFTLKAVMPADQQDAVNKNLEKLGDADQFLVDELGYNDKDDLYSHLAAEQVDSVALALQQAKKGNAFIIGDMTGIGKGRQAASLIRYAKKQGQVPVYFTKTAGLLSDVYRDLVDIGSPDLRPFVFGSAKEAAITDSDGKVVFALPSKSEVNRVLDYIEKNGKLPDEYDYVLTTYSQVSNGVYEFDENGARKEKKLAKGKTFGAAALSGQRRRDAIEKLMDNAYLILDESHTAGGNSGQGNYFQHIIQNAKNVTFFSATFAKRPDNMPIYALRTAMNEGGMKASDLIDAVKRGGATLQEIMSQTLTQCGQMIRRERDMTGVTIDWKAIDDPERVQEQREQYDSIIGLFNDIINFQKKYVSSYVDERNEELAAIQSTIGIKKGTAALGIKNQPFASKAFNTVQQVLLSLKAKSAAERAIDYLKQGMKPVIALNNTNESQTGNLALGEEMDAPDLGTSLKKGLEGTLRYTQKDAKNNSESGYIKLSDLGDEAVEAYHELEKKIEQTSTGLSLSPIDVIKNELQKAGYKVGELTGRQTEFVYNDNGTVTKVKRADTDKKKLARDFNDGKIDALILNKSAATGISLHASSKYKDQKKRVMIVAQQQLDVNDEVQMRGRIDRTGQVARGAYEYVVSLIPAEQRLLMMFKAKLKSLDANTTSSQKSKFNEMEVSDITNKYGDKVVKEYMAEHLDLYSRMADPFGWEKSNGEDLSRIDPQTLVASGGGVGDGEAGADASKLLGRMALLRVSEQEKMLQEIGELYANEIQRLNEMGENDLEITELPLKAKTLHKEVWKQGAEPGGDNAFAENTYIEKVNMAILKKPMKASEVKASQDGLTGGKTWDEYKTEKKAAVKEYFDKKIADETQKYEERAVKAATKAKEKYIKDAKKGQKDSGMSDEQIEKMAGYQYDNIYKQEKDKLNDVVKNLKAKAEMFERVLDTFDTNQTFVLPTDMNNPNELSGFGNSYGRLIDIKITDNYSPNASTVSFATLDGRRKITFPIAGKVGSGENKVDIIGSIDRMTKQASGMGDNHIKVLNKDLNNWDRLTSNDSRKDGYIVTGNLMQALVDSKDQGLGGQLVKYTTDTGDVKTGILMPDRFNPNGLTTDVPINSVADKFELSSWHGGIDEVTSSDGEVKVKRIDNYRGDYFELRVPKSKAKGGKYFMDEDLLKLVDGNNFETRGNNMLAEFKPEQLKPVLDRLSKMGVKVQEERKTSEDEGTHFREDRGLQYSKTDTKDVNNSRIIPEDVDKNVSSQIEKRFDDEVERLYGDSSEKPNIEKEANKYAEKQYIDTFEYDKKGNPIQKYEGLKSIIDSLDSKLKDIEQKYGFNRNSDINEIKRAIGSEGIGSGNWSADTRSGGLLEVYQRKAISLAAAQRAKEYLLERYDNIRLKYGLEDGDWASKEQVEKIFNDYNSDADVKKIFDRIAGLVDVLGTKLKGEAYTKVNVEGYYYHPKNYILIDTDLLSAIRFGKQELASAICHEMLHVVTSDIINLYRKGHGDLLNERQRKAAKEVVDLYDKINSYFERHFEGAKPYALTNPAEMITELANPTWRRIAEQMPVAKGWFRSFIAAVRNMLGFPPKVSALDRLDKALENVIRNLDYGVFQKGAELNDEIVNKKASIPVSSHITQLSEKTGGKVKMVSSVDEITNKAAKAAIEEGRNITGWYDEKTGEVCLYMPNIHDRYTAEKTIWHEVVGHKGMRELFGEERFEKFLRDVWYDLDRPENAALKKLVDEERKFNPMNIYNAIEEGIARLAEDGKGEAGFWNGIKNKVSDFLHEIGYRIAPNTKDVKYLLWLSKNLQKNPNDPYWKLRAEAVKFRLDHEDIRSVVSRDGVFYENDGKARSLADLPKADYQEATDGQIHFRTTPTAATALDRYHRSLDEHGYMATESFMDNMLSLKKLMNAIVPDKKIEDIASSENPYILQNVMQGAMSDAAKMFEINIMSPLEKSMAGVLDAFEGKKTDDKIRNFNLYMITKHGLERNRVLFVRDAVRNLRMDDSTKADAEKLQSEWDIKKEDLGNQLNSGIIDLKRYYEKMDEWIRDNVNKDYEAGEHDYSGMHGVQDIISMKDPYNDGEAIQSVMDSEAKMESVKAGSVRDYWDKVRAATRYSVDSDYNNGIIDRDLHEHVSKMFDWYVPLRNYDETTAEDVYGYITEIGDPKNRIGSTIAKARGHKYLSETNILAQIGALGNRAIKNGGGNAIKQAFARFARNHSDNNLIKETSVWYVKDPATGIVEERYPDIPEGARADEINQIVSDFDTDMAMLKSQGLATKKFDRGNIGYRFERAKDKSQHIVDVMIAGNKHSFVILGNPRAAQALNGMLEHKNESLAGRTTAAISRFMAQTCTSYNPEFVMRNMIRDFEFASTNLLAKEGISYTKTFEKYYAQVGLIEGIRNTKLSDFKKMTGFGLFSKYRNGTLDTSDKIQRYFKEFMENGGETGWVQIKNMKDLTAEYKLHVKTEKNGKARVSKNVFDFIFKNLENANEVAENLARFATYCASRDAGRSAVRSAYDAKEVSVNFNRHGSGNAIYSFKNGEMSKAKTARKNVYGFWASWFRNSSMFFNAGVQSTNLLIKNFKNNKAGTIGYIMAGPMMSGMAMALINNMLIASEDEKDRKGVKDPYGELPDYIRRNNLCIYVGGGEFITIPLAIEERAFYGLGDLAAGLTFSKNISGQKNPALDAVGCMSQLVPVADYLGNASFGKNPGEETIKAIAPSATSPIIEWFFNSDWKGAPIHRENKFDENQPSWMLAYKGTPEWLININKKANAWSNDVAPGNENMKGNDFLDASTDPSLLQHLYSSYLGGAATFMERVGGLVKKGKDTETKDIPFVRSMFYTPSEQTSLQRTKSKWYNYLDETEKMIANAKRLKSKKVPLDELVKNYGDYYKFKQSKGAEKMNVIETATKEMKKWKELRNKSNDAESINFANQNIDYIMMRAVNELDKLN